MLITATSANSTTTPEPGNTCCTGTYIISPPPRPWGSRPTNVAEATEATSSRLLGTHVCTVTKCTKAKKTLVREPGQEALVYSVQYESSNTWSPPPLDTGFEPTNTTAN